MSNPIRDAAIEAAAKVARYDEMGGFGKAWTDLLEGTRNHYRAQVAPLVDAVLNEVSDKICAEALLDAAENYSDYETFMASDGYKSIRAHGKSFQQWLRDKANDLR